MTAITALGGRLVYLWRPSMVEKKHSVCQLCGKASPTIICEACADRLRGAALEKKRKEEKAAS